MFSLSRSDIIQLFDFAQARAAIFDAYVAAAEGRASMAAVGYLAFPAHHGECHIKAGHIHGAPLFVTKIATGFYDNPQAGLATSNGMMIAIDARTGAPFALLQDEGWLTDMRTAIGGAIASHALARPEAQQVLIIGAGIQARLQAECLARLRPHLSFSLWARDPARAVGTAAGLADMGLSAGVAPDLPGAVGAAEIIITTTPATAPIVMAGWVAPGTHITAIGADSPGKQELETALVDRADLLVCDLAIPSLDHGEFQHASRQDVTELGHILSGAAPGRPSDTAITIADLTGIAPQDIAITSAILAAYNQRRTTT
jgi:ornithine cyclodeaminase/alanine dehydrogenase-like protein (mu-crystallin family)